MGIGQTLNDIVAQLYTVVWAGTCVTIYFAINIDHEC